MCNLFFFYFKKNSIFLYKIIGDVEGENPIQLHIPLRDISAAHSVCVCVCVSICVCVFFLILCAYFDAIFFAFKQFSLEFFNMHIFRMAFSLLSISLILYEIQQFTYWLDFCCLFFSPSLLTLSVDLKATLHRFAKWISSSRCNNFFFSFVCMCNKNLSTSTSQRLSGAHLKCVCVHFAFEEKT